MSRRSMSFAPADGVAVHAADAGVGERFPADAPRLAASRRRGSRGARCRTWGSVGHGSFVTAIVAFKALAYGGDVGAGGDGLVVGEGDGAVLALELLAAGAAHDDEGVAAAVEEDDGLLAAVEGGLGFVDEGAGEEMLGSGLLEFAAHVDQLDDGQRAVHDALVHLDEGVFGLLGVVPGFERRRRGAEDDGSLGEFGAHDGDVAGVVAGV